jgi:uncharacterized protein YcbK (DUF882 family)
MIKFLSSLFRLASRETLPRRDGLDRTFSGLGIKNYFREPMSLVNPILARAASDLLYRVEGLLNEIDWDEEVYINSGYRTPERNRAIGGAPNSYHTLARAVDINDPHHRLYAAIAARPDALEKFGLWMEDGKSARSWVHLDTGTRPPRSVRIFNP